MRDDPNNGSEGDYILGELKPKFSEVKCHRSLKLARVGVFPPTGNRAARVLAPKMLVLQNQRYHSAVAAAATIS